MSNEIIYPKEPKKPTPMPNFKKGVKPEEPPLESLWGVHDPAIYHDPVSGNYYIYCTHNLCYRSKDMIQWERIEKVIGEPPKESYEWVGNKGIWAPDIVKVGSEYRLYCSNSSWGSRQSCIFLAVADNAEGPFIPRGCVLKTSDKVPANAIDANIIEDQNTGEQYMVYGSFWGGCYILKLDKQTGLASEKGIGTCIARRPKWTDSSIEGPYIEYNPDNGYYYLFVSYGSLNSDYNIRVGRSKSVTGPYYDYNGWEMTDLEDDANEIGYLIHCGYQFETGQAWMGPGHNSVLRDFDNEWYLVSHIRPSNFKKPGLSTMHCHKIFWSKDGWPMINPCEYAGETNASFHPSDMPGYYERIKLTPAVPQGIQVSVPMKLHKDGRAEIASIQGHWQMTDTSTLEITYGNTIETFVITPAWDWDNWCEAIAVTGKDQWGICVWARKKALVSTNA